MTSGISRWIAQGLESVWPGQRARPVPDDLLKLRGDFRPLIRTTYGTRGQNIQYLPGDCLRIAGRCNPMVIRASVILDQRR